jgi:hypothetical protein
MHSTKSFPFLPFSALFCDSGFTALREALGMTSTTGLDEPEVSDSDEDETNQQQQQPAAAAAAPAAAAAGPSIPARRAKSEKMSEEERAARAQAVQAEVLQARSMTAAASDWDLDWEAEPEVVHTPSAPVHQQQQQQ